MPAFFRGVLNLRGTILPVIDLRLRFAFEPREDTKRTCVIVVRSGDDSTQTAGLLVDSVSEVKDIDPTQIESSISRPNDDENAFVTGLGKLGDRVVILLDVDRIVDINALAIPAADGGGTPIS